MKEWPELGIVVPDFDEIDPNEEYDDPNGFYEFEIDNIKLTQKVDQRLHDLFVVGLYHDEQDKVASLICNLEMPFYKLGRKQVDSARSKEALEGIKQARANLTAARLSLRSLPEPMDGFFDILSSRLEKDIKTLRKAEEHFKIEADRYSHRSNWRAVFVAKVLRAAFERYDGRRPTSSAEGNTATSEFCIALDEVYEIIGISANAFNFGKIALACPDDDEELLRIKTTLREKFHFDKDYPEYFCEITRRYLEQDDWNCMTLTAFTHDFSQTEESACRSLKTNVFTTTTMRNLISLHQEQNALNGGTVKSGLAFLNSGVE
ncbi:hypothetical protein V8J82_11325 [Gymnodinialimonas sp. 2305UL16-5]|uniref:hypothetical protein n=1 Tax=Gymnodinialimonas mytili TaxID=3126503 RepID=UPI0030A7B0A5